MARIPPNGGKHAVMGKSGTSAKSEVGTRSVATKGGADGTRGAGNGNRTRISSLGRMHTTTVLYPQEILAV